MTWPCLRTLKSTWQGAGPKGIAVSVAQNGTECFLRPSVFIMLNTLDVGMKQRCKHGPGRSRTACCVEPTIDLSRVPMQGICHI